MCVHGLRPILRVQDKGGGGGQESWERWRDTRRATAQSASTRSCAGCTVSAECARFTDTNASASHKSVLFQAVCNVSNGTLVSDYLALALCHGLFLFLSLYIHV